MMFIRWFWPPGPPQGAPCLGRRTTLGTWAQGALCLFTEPSARFPGLCSEQTWHLGATGSLEAFGDPRTACAGRGRHAASPSLQARASKRPPASLLFSGSQVWGETRLWSRSACRDVCRPLGSPSMGRHHRCLCPTDACPHQPPASGGPWPASELLHVGGP